MLIGTNDPDGTCPGVTTVSTVPKPGKFFSNLCTLSHKVLSAGFAKLTGDLDETFSCNLAYDCFFW